MNKKESIGILCSVLLVTVLLSAPLSHTAFASQKTKTNDNTKTKSTTNTKKITKSDTKISNPNPPASSNSTKAKISQDTMDKRNKAIESRHKKSSK